MKTAKYIKPFIGICLVAVFLIMVLAPCKTVLANDLWDSYEKPDQRLKDRLVDAADLLSSSEEEQLLNRLNSVSQKHSSNVVLLTTDDYSGYIQDFADDYFDYNGFQADYDGSGILFMLSMETREWAFSTSGTAIYAFTDYGQEYMTEKMLPYLKDGDYYNAFSTYIDLADSLLTMYEEGNPLDVNNSREPGNIYAGIAGSVAIGLIVALIVVGIMASGLHTVHMNDSAAGYQSHSGIKMQVHHDTYVRTTTSRTKLPDNDRSSGGGGGSSIHTSSSGSSHGGSHGHF
ncbi:MAG: TPM domain-containing protein [Butyrivibrio sp.]|nr:TPM domain-containing protein [Butyrivibrio sp.]